MQTEKSWYASKTMWGSILALLAGIAGLFGYAVSPEDIASIEQAIISLASVIGGLVAAYGRIKASKPIK